MKVVPHSPTRAPQLAHDPSRQVRGVELYDLEADPWETTNVAGDHAYSAQKRALLVTWAAGFCGAAAAAAAAAPELCRGTASAATGEAGGVRFLRPRSRRASAISVAAPARDEGDDLAHPCT